MNNATENKRAQWENVLNIELWPDQFAKVYKGIWSIMNNSKSRSFQYRLLMHALVTNSMLVKWKIPNVIENCTFCNNSTETVVHLVFECRCVTSFILTVFYWISKIQGYTEPLSARTILFN